MKWTPPKIGSLWPNARHEALLIAALAAPDLAADALHAWEIDFNPRDIDYETLTTLPLLYCNLNAHGIGSPHMKQYGAVYRWSWYRNRTRFAAAQQRLAALSAAGIPSLLLKGAALGALVYQDAGARAMGDVDLMVPSSRVAAAAEVLIGSGFAPVADLPALSTLLETRHSASFSDRDGMQIDLHWQAIPEDIGSNEDGLWEHAIDFDFFGVPARTLCPEDHLLHVVAHGSWGSLNTQPLHWVTDAVCVLRRFPDLDWGRVVRETKRRRLTLTLHGALRYLRHTFRAPVPAAVLQDLGTAAVESSERLEHWFKKRGPTRTPLGGIAPVWFLYQRMCRRSGRLPTPLGYLRFHMKRASLNVGDLMLRAVAWPVRQVYWMALAAAHDRGVRRNKA